MDHEQEKSSFLHIAGEWEGEAVSEGSALTFQLHFSDNDGTLIFV